MATAVFGIITFVLGAWLGFLLSCLCVASGLSDAQAELEKLVQEEEEDTDGSSL